MYRPQHCGRWNHPTQVSSLQKGEECSDGGDSSALSGQTLLCSGIVFALESEVPGSNLGAGTDSALGTTCITIMLKIIISFLEVVLFKAVYITVMTSLQKMPFQLQVQICHSVTGVAVVVP